MHDLVVRNGTVADGLGGPLVAADVAVDDGVITAVGPVAERGREEIDATDLLVTPGFVDPHTHYDGQATWDPLLTPSIWHGVTTVIMGNCGVGFAPAAPDHRDWLIGLMEGVEDIPGAAMREAMRWDWESVPEYLDALARMPRAVDVGAQIAHGAVRAYVMGERGAANEDPTPADVAAMADVVRNGIAAGAVGFSTNRLPWHKAVDGRPVPGTFAGEGELFALGRAVRDGSPDGKAVFSLILPTASGYDVDAWPGELDWMTRLSAETGLRFTFAFGSLERLPDVVRANAAGAHLVPMTGCRNQALLIGLRTRHPFEGRPSYEAISSLPLAERARRMRDPEVKARVLAEAQGPGWGRLAEFILENPDAVFPLEAPHAQEPRPETSMAAVAARSGTPVEDLVYDRVASGDGDELLMYFFGGYGKGNLDDALPLMTHPDLVLGLGDGGAHVSVICDAGYPTFVLAYWVRERAGGRLSLEQAVQVLTSGPARLYGLDDRGVIAPGRKADLNVIDPDRVGLHWPEVAHDLPAGAKRVVQRADGYVATIVRGEAVQRDGEDTGARPGALIRQR
jgi:N-acyl-D-aspartate/D-glutamate deacylase